MTAARLELTSLNKEHLLPQQLATRTHTARIKTEERGMTICAKGIMEGYGTVLSQPSHPIKNKCIKQIHI